MTKIPPYRILLVEDEDIISMLTEDMLRDLGYEIDSSVANLQDGLKAAVSDTIDVAMLDINLRGILSYPIADVLMERKIPFIFASGYSSQGIDPRYSRAIVLQKPFTAELLRRALSSALNEQPASVRS